MPKFRHPIAGPYNGRPNSTGSLTMSSGIVGYAIVGVAVVGLGVGVSTKDRRFVNCWTETISDSVTNTKTVYLVKRPGFASNTTPQAGSVGNAILVWTGQGAGTKVISAFGATNSSIYDGTTQLVTNAADTTKITGKAKAITETAISNTATLAITSSDNTAWYYQDAGTVTKITDADFPGNNSLTLAGTFAHLDGYAFIMDTNGNIWNSDLNSLTSWTAINVIAANSYPDKGVGLIRKGDKIMAFGAESIQFFYNAGNAVGSPLSRIESMTIKIGCANADAITRLGNSVYWTGSSPEGGISVYGMDDGVSKISSAEVDRVLILAGAANISMSAIKIYGRSFVIVDAATVTFVYCVEEKLWHQWSSGFHYWSRTSGVSAGNEQVNYSISTDSTSGKVFIVNPGAFVFQDNGVAYTATAQSARMGSGQNRVYYQEVELICDTQDDASEITIAAYDDDYVTATVIGTVDMADARPRLTRCGSAYRRAWLLSHSANTGFRIEALAGRSEEGTH